MSEQSSGVSQKAAKANKAAIIRAWALVLLAVLAGGAVFLRGRRLVDNIIPVSTEADAPAESPRNE